MGGRRILFFSLALTSLALVVALTIRAGSKINIAIGRNVEAEDPVVLSGQAPEASNSLSLPDRALTLESEVEREIGADPLVLAAKKCFDRPHDLYIEAIVNDADLLLDEGDPVSARAAMEAADSLATCEDVRWEDAARMLAIYEYHASRGNSYARILFARYLVSFSSRFSSEREAALLVRQRSMAALGWMELEARSGNPEALLWVIDQSTSTNPDLILEEDLIRYGTYSVSASVINAGVDFEFAIQRYERSLRSRGVSEPEIAQAMGLVRLSSEELLRSAQNSDR